MEKLPPQKGSTHFPMPQTAPNSHYLCLVYIEIHAENPKTALGKTMNTTEKGRNKIFFPLQNCSNESQRVIFSRVGEGLNPYSGKRGPAGQTCSRVKERMERIYCNIPKNSGGKKGILL